ncbi:MAG: GAF domain-containing protein [Actinobacteria bacterium]|nr:MAG: GAF domain-containing protein [Actinomycetota bacterium]
MTKPPADFHGSGARSCDEWKERAGFCRRAFPPRPVPSEEIRCESLGGRAGGNEKGRLTPPFHRERSRRSACGCRRPRRRHCFRAGAPQRTADRQDAEADAAQQQCDSDDDAEERHLLGHVARVERGRQGGLGHPDVTHAVVDRPLRLGVDDCILLVVRAAALGELTCRRAWLRREAPHLRIRETARCLERMDPHVLREHTRLGARVDGLAGDALGREADRRRKLRLLGLGLDRARRHVRCAHDRLLAEVVVDRAATVDAEDDRGDAECDENDAGGDPAILEELLVGGHLATPFAFPAFVGRSLPPGGPGGIRRAPSAACGFPAHPVRRFCDDHAVETRESVRLRTLLDTGIAISSELALDPVLERIVEAAAALTGARYAALGVIDRTGMALERFITTGIDEETRTTIGEEPHGRGILGVLIRDAVPLRLHDIGDDPRSVGFPPGHPPMATFLGVPILLRGVAYGNLYLSEKADETDFTDEDEEIVTLLAAQAAVAVENARLYESATEWSRQLESLNEIGNALLTELDLKRLLELVARRLRELIDARVVAIALPEGDELRIEAAAGEGAEALTGSTLPRDGSKAGRILDRRRSERVDSLLDDPEVHASVTRLLGARSGLYVPLLVRDEAIGVLIAHDRLGRDVRFGDSAVRLAEQFAARAAIAVDLSRRVATDALRRVVAGQELERKRLARELHDETGQALTSILLGLKAVEGAGSQEETRRAAEDLRALVVATLQDRDRAPARGAARARALTGRGRDDALSHRPGGAHERRQARRGRARQHPDRAAGGNGDGGDRGRRPRLRPGGHARSRPRIARDAGASRLGRRPRGGRVVRRVRDDARGRGSGPMIRAVIVDDHAVVRSGIKLLLEREDDIERRA